VATRATIVVFGYLLLNSAAAHACSFRGKTLSENVDNAGLVMVVQVTESKFDPEHAMENISDYRPVSAKFRLVETIKGDATGVNELVSGFGHGDCGVGLAAGQYFIVMAPEPNKTVGVWITTGSVPLNHYDPVSDRGNFMERAHIQALKNYVRNGVKIDRCFDWLDVPPPLNAPEFENCRRKAELLFGAH
jgi:hypothetical protein